jgi:hypothetical protein
VGRRIAVRALWSGSVLLAAATLAAAQGLIIPDLRKPGSLSAPPSSSCRMCGEIRSIREVHGAMVSVTPNPSQTAAGNPNDWAVVGAAIVIPTGPDSRSGQTHVGAVGTPEMVERFSSNAYEVEVRMDTGERVVLQRRDAAFFRVGDRVTVNGAMMQKI